MQKLIRELSKLPSVGVRTATRLATHLVCTDSPLIMDLSHALLDAKESIQLCEECYSLTESTMCNLCSNPHRDEKILCVVEKPTDVYAIEKMGYFRGKYHVLLGVWSPLQGTKTDHLTLESLFERVQQNGVQEVILATSATVQGDATALYIAQELAESGVSCTRLAQGMPKGGELEYTDEVTLARAFEGRKSF